MPTEYDLKRDEQNSLVLVLEPDIIVQDVETIQKEDNLYLTSRKNLKTIQQAMMNLGMSMCYNQHIQQQNYLREQIQEEMAA